MQNKSFLCGHVCLLNIDQICPIDEYIGRSSERLKIKIGNKKYKFIIAKVGNMIRRQSTKGEHKAIEHIRYMARAIYHNSSPDHQE